ncbi:DUF2007 domain-containing protein [Aliiglaciecola sp. LCG003]|uniref:putative signal transducing protein n=1 Tax=Aliiglaciecola sp. LCG003 TaxID=3053655 RepID=UPI0025737481|nr:DUF2007 domain-containing protein [Aliiglaciecola sp. LCG003]WJG08663.1 DUF2007 domain-containing protein [Aliiglaciecola sp. LCG003]
MQKIYWHNDRFRVYQIKQILDDHQIPNFIKNEFAIGAIGELSPMDIMPEVWLTDDGWEAKARSLIAEFNQPAESTQSWQCPQCQESNEGNFSICWNCSSAKAESEVDVTGT